MILGFIIFLLQITYSRLFKVLQLKYIMETFKSIVFVPAVIIEICLSALQLIHAMIQKL